MRIPVKTWDNCGTTFARTIGGGRYRVSCTAGADRAVENLAAKWYGPRATSRRIEKEDRDLLAARRTQSLARQIYTEATHIIEL